MNENNITGRVYAQKVELLLRIMLSCHVFVQIRNGIPFRLKVRCSPWRSAS